MFRALLVLLCCAFAAGLPAQTAPPLLFSESADYRAAAIEQTEADPVEVLRSRPVGLGKEAIAALAATANQSPALMAAAPAVQINLFPDTLVPFHVESVEPTHDGIGLVIQGYPGGDPEGKVILTTHRDAMSASVRMTNGEFYEMFVAPGGEGEIRQVRFRGGAEEEDDFVIPEEDENGIIRRGSGHAPRPFQGFEAMEGAERHAGAVVTVDFLIAYTARAREARGGASGILAHINTVFAQTNAAFAASAVNMQVRLVHAVEVNYNDTTGVNYNTALAALRTPSDGSMDEVHSLRQQYGADMVALFVAPPGAGTVGIGYMMVSNPQSFAGYAFSVSNQAYAGGTSLTFAHEVGHNLGLNHDIDNGGTNGGFHIYSRGYQQKTQDPKFRTIMSYSSGCSGCTSIGVFSNPDITHSGIPAGIPNQADSVRTLNYTAPFAAAWRAAPAQSCSYSASPASISVGSGATTRTVTVSAASGCAWTAASSAASWITVTSGASGSGNGTVTLSIAANPNASTRTGTVIVAGQTVTVTQTGASCSYSLNATSFSVANGSGTRSVTVTSASGCAWTATSSAGWITVTSGASGSGNGTVTLSFTANPNASTRTGTVTIAGQTVTFTQAAAACSYSLSATSFSVANGSGTRSVTVTSASGCAWTATSSAGWITVTSGASGLGNGTVTLSFTANPNVGTRTGTVTIAGQTVTFTQAAAACSYSLSATSFSVANGSGTRSVTVTSASGCAWTAASNASWITVTSGTSGSGNGTVTLSFTANPNASTRTGTVTIAGQAVTFTQAAAPCEYTLSATSLSTGNGSGSATVTVSSSSGCAWTAASSTGWITVTGGASGSANGAVTLSFAANPNTSTRSGTVTIAGQTVTVTQAAVPCSYSLGTASISVAASQSAGSVAVTANAGCAWTASPNAGWITVAAGSTGTGSGSVALSIAANPGTSPRTGTVTIAGQTVTVTQAAAPCEYTLSTASISTGSQGGSAQVAVSTAGGCAWTTVPQAGWISVSGGGSGNGGVSVTVAANPGQTPRTGTVTIAGHTVTVTQQGMPAPVVCSYSIDSTSVTIPSGGGSRNIAVSAGDTCAWTASPGVLWISLVGSATGSGSGTVSLSIAPNPGQASRTGMVTIAGQTLTVTQQGQPAAPVLSLSQTQIVIGASEGSLSSSPGIGVHAGEEAVAFSIGGGLPSWLNVTPTTGSTPGSIALHANAQGLAPGTYTATVNVNAPGTENGSVSLAVTLQVSAKDTILATPQALSFRSPQGGAETIQTVALRSGGGAVMVQGQSSAPWLTAAVVSGQGGWSLRVGTNPAGLAPGIYDATLLAYCVDGSCDGVTVPVRLHVTPPRTTAFNGSLLIASGGIVNAASFAQGLSEGSWATIFGEHLSPEERLWTLEDFDGSRMPLSLGGVSVTVDGKPAAIHYIGGGQVNFQVPSGIGKGWVPVEVSGPLGSDLAYAYASQETPGLFQFDAAGQVAAIIADGRPVMRGGNGTSARPGQIIAIFGTGFGPTDPDVQSGEIFQGAAPLVAGGAVEVRIGGKPAVIHFAGLSAAGLNQLNVAVPQLPAGDHEIEVVINGVSAQFGGRLPVQ